MKVFTSDFYKVSHVYPSGMIKTVCYGTKRKSIKEIQEEIKNSGKKFLIFGDGMVVFE